MLVPEQLPKETLEKIRKSFNPDERILWIGKPKPTAYAKRTLIQFLFGILWTAFALFWMYGASGGKIPHSWEEIDLFPLFGIPIVLVGLIFLYSPIYAMHCSKKVYYVVTNQRAIIFRLGRKIISQSFDQKFLQHAETIIHSDGSGDIIFIKGEQIKSIEGIPVRQTGFFGIPQVREVLSYLKKLDN